MDKKIKLLCSAADREALAPVIAQLKEKGLHVSELGSGTDGKEVVLAVLSEGFFADGALKERLLGLIGAGGSFWSQWYGQILSALIGAVVLLWVWNLIKKLLK